MSKLNNPCWEMFCVLFMGKHRGNRTQAYIEAYKRKVRTEKEYRTCQVNGSKLLSIAILQDRCRELMDKSGITAEKLDSKLLFLVDQMEDNKVALGAIKEGNSVLKRTGHSVAVSLSQINYEQHIINNTYGQATVREPLREDESQFQRVPEALPQDQHQSVGADQIQKELGPGDLRVQDRGAGTSGEAYPGFGA